MGKFTNSIMETLQSTEIPLTERAYRDLRKAIVRCEYEPGERLRVEDLAKRLDISSSPVREALSRLSEQGFVRSLDKRGFRVAPLTTEDIMDLTRVRRLIEGEALRDAIAHGTDAWEAAIVAAGHSLGLIEQRLGGKPVALDNAWSERHRTFHLAFYSTCTSSLLLDLVNELFDRAERYRRFSASHRVAEISKHNEHEELMRVVLSRDIAQAVEHLLRHISSTEKRVCMALELIQSQGKS
jgi:GntR family transcriptional regulator, carbon starvation induced regulator